MRIPMSRRQFAEAIGITVGATVLTRLGESKAEAEETFRRVGAGHLDTVIMRPKTFLGSGRLGVFEILFACIREGRRTRCRSPPGRVAHSRDVRRSH